MWAKGFGGAGMQRGHRVAASSSGDVYVAGTFEGSIDLGGGALESHGGTDVFVAKLDGSGAHLWSVALGDALAEETFGLTVRSDGNVVVSGSFEGAVDFGGGVLSSAGDSDGFVVALDPTSGAHICSSRVGGPGYDVVSAVAAEDDGDTDIIGMFGATADLGAVDWWALASATSSMHGSAGASPSSAPASAVPVTITAGASPPCPAVWCWAWTPTAPWTSGAGR
ncbi:MAG: hypothetical protein WKG00_19320 [Polyangiaceae bacterium]